MSFLDHRGLALQVLVLDLWPTPDLWGAAWQKLFDILLLDWNHVDLIVVANLRFCLVLRSAHNRGIQLVVLNLLVILQFIIQGLQRVNPSLRLLTRPVLLIRMKNVLSHLGSPVLPSESTSPHSSGMSGGTVIGRLQP